jgi:hypothetical protein
LAVLVGDSHLLVDMASVEGQRTLRPEVRRWRHVQVGLRAARWEGLRGGSRVRQTTATYLNENWPIEFLAADEQGTHLALAGKRGFALYYTVENKWRLFGNLHHVSAPPPPAEAPC